MKLTKKSLLGVIVFMMVFCIALTGCAAEENAKAEELSLILAEEEFTVLDQFPNLKKLDLTGTDCYEAILAYAESHPQVDVTYSVSLGTEDYRSDVTELELKPGNFEYQALLENLKYLPGVQKISFPDTDLAMEQFEQPKAAYPNITLDYMAPLLGTMYEPGVEQLDLSHMQPDQVAEVVSHLPRFTKLTYVELMDGSGKSSLAPADVKTLQDAAPGVTFHYSFNLFGKTVSTTDEVIVYDEVEIGNEGEAKIREALDILDSCKQFKLDNCGVDTPIMASLREDYPHIQIDWRIRISYYNICTDETFLRMHVILDNTTAADLKYCTKVQYMDISSNSKLTDISFIESMPELQCLIASNCPITDLSPLENLQNMTWLELGYCKISDLAPLSGCENLKYLNISHTGVSDLTPVNSLPLERFIAISTALTDEAEAAFQAAHSSCITRWEGNYPYGTGWRFNEDGKTYFEYYNTLREIFRYDDNTYYGNRKDRQFE